jgi:hypothetical protein
MPAPRRTSRRQPADRNAGAVRQVLDRKTRAGIRENAYLPARIRRPLVLEVGGPLTATAESPPIPSSASR